MVYWGLDQFSLYTYIDNFTSCDHLEAREFDLLSPGTMKWQEDIEFVLYVSMYICSPFVITLVPTFIDGF